MVRRWRWALAIAMLSSWVGCSGSSKQNSAPPVNDAGAGNVAGNAGVSNAAGTAPVTGGTTSEGGEAGGLGEGGSLAGTSGTAGAPAGAGVGGSGAVGGIGGISGGGVSGGGMGATAGGGGEPSPPPVPPTWSCLASLFADGVCHCGCSVVDFDCEDATAGACESCPSTSCAPGACNGVKADDNAVCAGAPLRWICEAGHYDDGVCDCGCGYWDPDCVANEILACARCDSPGSCSPRQCPSSIDPVNIAYCTGVVVPETWRCGAVAYDDKMSCDCGCGAPDLDCLTSDIGECDDCYSCGADDCPDNVDPSDPTQCLPPPEGWACNIERFGDRVCDCGCGARDFDCIRSEDYCWECPPEGCTRGDCARLDPMDNTRCTAP